jgi:hypothetical protein
LTELFGNVEPIDLGINVAVDDKDLLAAVVIDVEKVRSPSEVLCVDC